MRHHDDVRYLTVDEAHERYPHLWPLEIREGEEIGFEPGLAGHVEIYRGWAIYRAPRTRARGVRVLSNVDDILGAVSDDAPPNGPFGVLLESGEIRR